MTKEQEGLKPSIDWDFVEERAGQFVGCVLAVILCGGACVVAACIMAAVPLSGILLALDGWWGLGVPVFLVGAVFDASVLVYLFAKLMAWIKGRMKDG